ncbi:MAG: FG-GAP-like repeat-containing protein, partial [Patescibacteria group bacterium]
MNKTLRNFFATLISATVFFVGSNACYADFSPVVNYSVGSNPRAVFAVDLDKDGDSDLATANYSSNSVSILVNNGDGTFATAVNYAVGNRPATVFAADLDGDGDNDLAVANYYSDNVSVLLNNGDGT